MLRVVATVFVAALFVAPAQAGELFAELHGGYDGVVYAGHSYPGIDYGGGLGYEVTWHRKIYAAVQADLDNSTSKSSALGTRAALDLSAFAKLGVDLTEHISVYALGGYSRARLRHLAGRQTLDGVRGGLGWRYRIDHIYVKGEFDFTHYEKHVKRYQGIAGVGYMF